MKKTPKKTASDRNPKLIESERRWIIIDILQPALSKSRRGMLAALTRLLDADLVHGDDRVFHVARAADGLDAQECEEMRLFKIFADEHSDARALHLLGADTLIEQIAGLRECAYWIMHPDGQAKAEELIQQQLKIYGDVRTFVRILLARDTCSEPSDPAPIPEIPANRYLEYSHPVVTRAARCLS